MKHKSYNINIEMIFLLVNSLVNINKLTEQIYEYLVLSLSYRYRSA